MASSTVLRPTQHKIGHFEDGLPSQSLGSVLKKTNTQQNYQHKTKVIYTNTETQKYKLNL